jgi:hypothetical protein
MLASYWRTRAKMPILLSKDELAAIIAEDQKAQRAAAARMASPQEATAVLVSLLDEDAVAPPQLRTKRANVSKVGFSIVL